MAIRWYVSDVIGTGTDDGTDDAFRPALADLPLTSFRGWDGRVDHQTAEGWMLVRVDATNAQHNAIEADARNRHLPFDNGIDQPLSSLSQAAINALRTWAESNHIPVTDLTGQNTILDFLRRVEARLQLRQYLLEHDYTEHFDLLVSQIPQQKRQTLAAMLTAAGYDVSVVQGSDTVRQALLKLIAQHAGRPSVVSLLLAIRASRLRGVR